MWAYINDCTFLACNATNMGGGLYLYASGINVRDGTTKFTSCSAAYGGSISVYDESYAVISGIVVSASGTYYS